jgi:medium-chain acyl-[acyl-carrier-protein] hydrolase
LKADFAAYEEYAFEDIGELNCPVTVFAGMEDRGMKPEVLEGWSRHTQGRFVMHTVAGDHFFLTVSKEFVLATIQNSLRGIAATDLVTATGPESA